MGCCANTKSERSESYVQSKQSKIDSNLFSGEVAFDQITSTYQQIELFISCRNLKDKDIGSKSDPQVTLLMMEEGQWKQIDRTEIVKDNLNPDFARTFKIDCIFETQQQLCFKVEDVDDKSRESLGQTFTTVAEIVGAANSYIIKDLNISETKKAGKIAIRSEMVCLSQGKENIVIFELQGRNLANKDALSKSDPFLTISRSREDHTWVKIYQTEHIKDNENPHWKKSKITVQKLCNYDEYRPLKIECWDYNENGNHDYIGEFQISLDEMKQKPVKQLKDDKKPGKDMGQIHFTSLELYKEEQFLDYIYGNLQLGFMVAIDFTLSNNEWDRPASLHYIAQGPSQYEQAIMGIGGIVEYYDFDKWFPVWGFGGILNGQMSHCFNLTQQQQVQGIQGILNAYRNILPSLKFGTSTLFGQILKSAIEVAKVNYQNLQNDVQQYSVLLIMTDGLIHDLDQTKRLIIEASGLPLSIIIVGIGNEDFSKMEELDSDKGLLKDNQGTAQRDIVQFVPFRKFKNDGPMLAKQVLAEIPKQLEQYMKSLGIRANQRQQVEININF